MLSTESITWLISQGAMEWTGQLRGDGLLLTLGSPLQPLSAPGTLVVDLADQSSIDDLYGEPVTEWKTQGEISRTASGQCLNRCSPGVTTGAAGGGITGR
ncbi:hypothetical protein J8N05_18745 [Streptomyces sp. BH-SS-21]|uniref:Uncharacterized protein n=1 Tax=Streptomyces liliiviolaceus TaxID=2823109 RepID=A0A940XUN2_9ACTN|nr:hypothetical protein [Streptomyces liliiviolaceus]MBQ0850235.1 hypothetical protein [Streptomyces liliiviolaceus]